MPDAAQAGVGRRVGIELQRIAGKRDVGRLGVRELVVADLGLAVDHVAHEQAGGHHRRFTGTLVDFHTRLVEVVDPAAAVCFFDVWLTRRSPGVRSPEPRPFRLKLCDRAVRLPPEFRKLHSLTYG
jgi:hypothetical protein